MKLPEKLHYIEDEVEELRSDLAMAQDRVKELEAGRATMQVDISDLEDMTIKFLAMIDAMKTAGITEAEFYLDASDGGEWGIEATTKEKTKKAEEKES